MYIRRHRPKSLSHSSEWGILRHTLNLAIHKSGNGCKNCYRPKMHFGNKYWRWVLHKKKDGDTEKNLIPNIKSVGGSVMILLRDHASTNKLLWVMVGSCKAMIQNTCSNAHNNCLITVKLLTWSFNSVPKHSENPCVRWHHKRGTRIQRECITTFLRCLVCFLQALPPWGGKKEGKECSI